MIKQQPGNHSSLPDHEQDDCDGCQNQRKQNNMLVDFYERLNNIETKIVKIKQDVGVQRQSQQMQRSKLQQMGSILVNKPDGVIKMIKEHSSKEMGYELASALIQREIKTKMENQRLQAVIDQLQRDKKRLEDEKKSHQEIFKTNLSRSTDKSEGNSMNRQSRYSDVIDEVRNTDDSYFIGKKKSETMNSSYFIQEDRNKKYWEDASLGQDQTSFSAFTTPPNKQKRSAQQYAGINLWLYQFKPEQMNNDSPVKSLRKPGRQPAEKAVVGKYKTKF